MTWPPAPSEVAIRILDEQRVGTVRFFRLRFCSHAIAGQPLWVYAVLATPAGAGPWPGLLHLHGGLQTASEETVIHFAGRGYVTLSFDWFGPTAERPAAVTTVFPEEIPSIDDRAAPFERARVFHIVQMARAGLTVLAARDDVEKERLGLIGISWGGFATWLVNGLDSRVKAAIPVFGCDLAWPATEAERAWRAAFMPGHFVAAQHGPVLYLNGTNDFAGRLPEGQRMFDRVSVDRRVFLGPNENHGLWPETLATATAWLDHYLKGGPAVPESPRLSLEQRGAHVQAVGVARSAIQVSLYFSYGTSEVSPGAFWREWPASGTETSLAEIPLWKGVTRLQVIVLARYADGSALTGFPETVEIGACDASLPSRTLTHGLYDPGDGISPWFSQWRWRRTEVLPIEGRLLVSAESDEGGRLLRFHPGKSRKADEPVFDLMLRSPACPLVSKGGVEAIELELRLPDGGRAELTASAAGPADIFEAAPSWCAQREIPADSRRQIIRFDVMDFVSANQENPAGFSFTSLNQLGLRLWSPGAQPGIGRIRLA